MSHEPLFYRSPLVFEGWELDKYANERGHKIPEDEAKWGQAITSYVASNIPYLSKHPVEVALDDKDAKQGYAKGRLIIAGGKAVVPLIIRDFRLLPLDVFLHEEQFLPLSEKTVEEVLMNKSLGSKPVKRKSYRGENTNLERSSTPPRSAYTHGNAGYKIGHIIERVAVREEDVKFFKEKIASDRGLAIAMYQNGKTFMDKLSSAEVIPEGGYPEKSMQDRIREISIEEEWPCNVIQITKTAGQVDGEWIYSHVDIYSSSDYCPMAYEKKSMSREHAETVFGKEAMDKVAQDGVHTIVMGRGGFTFNTPAELEFPVEPMEKFGQYDALSTNNRIVRGFFIPEVFDYGMSKIANMKLFASRDCYAMQEKIAGRKVYAGPRAELESANIREGVTGTFVFRYGEKTAALEPFTVSSFPVESGEQITFDAFSTRGEAMHFTVMPGLAAASPGEKRGHYLVPSFWQFVNVGKFSEPLIADRQELTKNASASKRLELMWDGVNYTIRGEQVKNMSQQLFDLDGMKARFFLTAFGVTPDHADKLLKRAKSQGHAEFEATVKPTGEYEVVTNAIRHRDGSVDTKYASAPVDEIISVIRSSAMIKEALLTEEPETVDKVLSLNFVSRDNLREFVDSIDDYKDAQSKLARLLVAARLGIKQVDPLSVKTAMENLGTVISGLETLRSAGMGRKQSSKRASVKEASRKTVAKAIARLNPAAKLKDIREAIKLDSRSHPSVSAKIFRRADMKQGVPRSTPRTSPHAKARAETASVTSGSTLGQRRAAYKASKRSAGLGPRSGPDAKAYRDSRERLLDDVISKRRSDMLAAAPARRDRASRYARRRRGGDRKRVAEMRERINRTVTNVPDSFKLMGPY